MATNLSFQIQGMRCGHCAERIKSILETKPGVKIVEVSFEDKEAKLLVEESTVSKDELKKAIEDAGYMVVDE